MLVDARDNGSAATWNRRFAGVVWVKLAAEQGHADAQNSLGNIYAFDDNKAAFKWYMLAAEQGNADAQNELVWMYGNGEGVIQDYTLALMWLDIAASRRNENIFWKISRYDITKKLTPSQIEKAQKLARECVAKNYKGC